MTEDDTFNKLKKPDYYEMREKVRALSGAFDLETFLNTYGWTFDEYRERTFTELMTLSNSIK